MVIQLTPRMIVFTLFKRWRAFAAFLVFTVLVTSVTMFLLFWQYESTAVVIPKFDAQDLADAQLQAQQGQPQQSATPGDLAKLIVESMADTASSYDVERYVVDTIGVANLYPRIASNPPWFFGTATDAAVKKLDDDLDVTEGKESTSLLFSLQNPDPQMARKALNLLLGKFLEVQAKVEQNPRAELLQQQLDAARKKVGDADSALLDFKRKEKVSDLDTERKLMLNQRDDYQESLSNALAALAGSKDSQDQLTKLLAGTPADIALTDENDQTKDEIDNAKSAMLTAEQNYLVAQQTYKPKSQLLQDKEQALELARQQYQQLTSSPGKRVRSGANPVHQTIETQLKQTEAQVASSQATVDSWRQRLAEVSAQLDHLDAVQGGIDELQRQLDVASQDYTSYLQRTEEARIKQDLDKASASSLTVVQQPNVPYIPKRFVLVTLIGIAAGILGGIGICLALEVADETFGLPQQIEPALGVPVLITLNQRGNGAKKRSRWRVRLPKRAA